MPAQYGKDTKGCWVRWGNSGTKYHYACGDTVARKRAIARMEKQRKAIYANKQE